MAARGIGPTRLVATALLAAACANSHVYTSETDDGRTRVSVHRVRVDDGVWFGADFVEGADGVRLWIWSLDPEAFSEACTLDLFGDAYLLPTRSEPVTRIQARGREYYRILAVTSWEVFQRWATDIAMRVHYCGHVVALRERQRGFVREFERTARGLHPEAPGN